MQLGRGSTKCLVSADRKERRGKGIALLASFALRHGPTGPRGVPPAIAGGLAVKEPHEVSKTCAHCLASVLATRRRRTSPVAMPRTLPSGLRNAARRAMQAGSDIGGDITLREAGGRLRQWRLRSNATAGSSSSGGSGPRAPGCAAARSCCPRRSNTAARARRNARPCEPCCSGRASSMRGASKKSFHALEAVTGRVCCSQACEG